MEAGSAATHEGPAPRLRGASVLERILPRSLDNRYRGQAAALWIFAFLVVMKGIIDLTGIVAPEGGAKAVGIPLASFSPAGAQAVIGVGALLGVEGLMLGLLFLVALVRYRAMIPLMYLVLAIEFLAHKGAGLAWPILPTGGSSGTLIPLALFAVTLIGLALAVTGRGYSACVSSRSAR